MSFESNHRQQATLAQTRMRKGRSSLYGFGLGFQLQRADPATNFDYWFSMDDQPFMLMLRSRIQVLLYWESIRHLDQIESAFVILFSSSMAIAAKDFDSDYCFFDQSSSHYWMPLDSTGPCLNWSCPVFDVCHHVHKIYLYFLRRNLTYPALVLALSLTYSLLLTYSFQNALISLGICDQHSLQCHLLLAN